MGDFTILTISSVINVLLALFVIARNPRALINRVFAGFSLSLVLWTVCNFMADQAASHNLLYTRLTFAAAALIALGAYELSNVFPFTKPINHYKTRRLEWVLALNTILVSLTPWVVPSVTKLARGVELEVGFAYYLYIVYVIHIVVLVFWNFHRQTLRANIRERNQIALLRAGIILYALLAGSANLVLPILVNDWSSSRFGPIFTLLFVGSCTYAIVRHRLLDIRLVVARSLAYLLVLVTLAAMYALTVFVVADRLFADNDLVTQRIVPLVAVTILAFTAPALRERFDTLTSRIFYRDAYDPQVMLNTLNEVLVSTIDIKELLQNSAQSIERNIKPEFCAFILRPTSEAEERVVGTTDQRALNPSKLLAVVDHHAADTRQVVVVDNLEDHHKELRHALQANHVAVLVQLAARTQSTDPVGYMLLGVKKSGNLYTPKDIGMFEIIGNELIIAVQNALRFEEIAHFNVTLQKKIDSATAQLRMSNQKLRQMDETKDDFISMASHQLRTPLTSVKGYLSMVIEGDAGKITTQQEKLLSQAFISSQRMVYLIADLLNVSRLRTGKFVLEPSHVNLSEIIQSEVGQLIDTASARGLKLSYKRPASFPELALDETKIRQVIMNFIDNAIYYTPNGGHIEVALGESAEAVTFTVTDDGIGVPRAEQHHLFTKFYRAANARRARPDGTGLGLFMAKKVVIAQGGSIIFKSQEGKGSTFGFSFSKRHLASRKADPED